MAQKKPKLDVPLAGNKISSKRLKRSASETRNVGWKKNERDGSAPPSLEMGFIPRNHFRLEKVGEREWKMGPTKEYIYRIYSDYGVNWGVDPQLVLLRANRILHAALEDMIATAPANSLAQVHIVNQSLNLRCISSHIREPSALDIDDTLQRLSNAMLSDENVKLGDTQFFMTVASQSPAVGYRAPGIRSRKQYSIQAWAQIKDSVYDPLNSANRISGQAMNLCIPLIIAKELWIMETGSTRGCSKAKNFLRSRHGKNQAFHILKLAGFRKSDLVPLDKMDNFAPALPEDVVINFYEGSEQQPAKVVGCKGSEKAINIFIRYNETERGCSDVDFHAYGIASMSGFLGTNHWCPKCYKGYQLERHKCPEAQCQLCSQLKCQNRRTEKTSLRHQCDNCFFSHFTAECLQAHLPNCGSARKCQDCGEISRKKGDQISDHMCGKPLCRLCNINHSPFEYCYVQKDKPKKQQRRNIWYADTETTVDPESGEHTANLLVLQKDTDPQDSFVQYFGITAMKDFTEECMAQYSMFKNSTIIFHNAAGFDAHLWWRELVKCKAQPRKIIRKGQKIISFELCQNGIRCRDSLQFIPGTPLKAFPKMFGLESGPKGDFPYGLNTREWIRFGEMIKYKESIGGQEHRFPPLSYFWPEKKRTKELAVLKQWHQEQVELYKNDPTLEYCPEYELIRYCQQDVRILRMGFTKYRETWLEQYPEMEPTESLTFPAYNNAIFRNQHMGEHVLCVLPPLGFSPKNLKFSEISLAWIGWKERELGLSQVRTARKGFEVKIGGHHVDGVGVDAQGHRHVLNFHGCLWHGHRPCHRVYGWNDELQARKVNTENGDKKLKELGESSGGPYGSFTYHTIYACELEQAQKENPKLDRFINDYLIKLHPTSEPGKKVPQEKRHHWGPIRPRDALRGGRTEVIQHRILPVAKDHQLYYLDFTSLYPSVNFGLNGEVWPTGPPIIYIGKDLDPGEEGLSPPAFAEWFGLAKVVILPPKRLKHPVLGERVGGRLLFHLCSTCAREKRQDFCPHSDSERAIHGTFFTGELQLAVKHGYKLQRVHELWHWPEKQRSSDLFRSLLRDQLAKKIKSSGKPKDSKELDQLVKDCRERLGIFLKPEDFEENPALRSLAKFAINNIWGFHGKHNDVEVTEVLTSYSRFLELQNDEDRELKKIRLTEDNEYFLVSSKSKTEDASRKGCIMLAVLTAAYARMALYKVLDEYKYQVVYMDTDSVFLYLPPTIKPPPTSSLIGHLKDEVLDKYGKGAEIIKFTSIGPKCYTYQVRKSDGEMCESELRMKGIAFSADASEKITPATLEMMSSKPSHSVHVNQHVIRKDFFAQRLWNHILRKKVRKVSDKRWLQPGQNTTMDTFPYGYARACSNNKFS